MTKQEKVFSPTSSIQQYEDSPEILYLSNMQRSRDLLVDLGLTFGNSETGLETVAQIDRSLLMTVECPRLFC